MSVCTYHTYVCVVMHACVCVCTYIYCSIWTCTQYGTYVCVCAHLSPAYSVSICLLSPVHPSPASHLPPIFLPSVSHPIFLPSVHCLMLTSHLSNAMAHHPDSMFLSSVSCHLVGALLMQFLSGALGINGESQLRQFKRRY